MKRWVPLLVIFLMSYSTTINARPCTPHHEVIRTGDSALSLALRAGVEAGQFDRWAAHIEPGVRRSLKQLRPGDQLDICVATRADGNNTVYRLAVVRDEQGRRAADRVDLPPSPVDIVSLANVTGDVLTSPSRVAPMAISVQTSSVAAKEEHDADDLKIRQLDPGLPLEEALIRLLGQRPVVDAILAYAKHAWNLPARIPEHAHYALAMRPSHAPGGAYELAYFEIDDHGRDRRVYHYVDKDGHDFVVGPHGRGYEVLKPILPVNDARLSSGWGWRIQPVLGGDEFHQGIDYAAPMGTPVRAAMDGVVGLSEWRGAYGRVVELKHTHGLATRYAHLSRFAAAIHPGTHVHRGQVIGYVGSTGLSTGPHLYYEVWERGTRVNPLVHARWIVVARLDTKDRQQLVAHIDHAKAAP